MPTSPPPHPSEKWLQQPRMVRHTLFLSWTFCTDYLLIDDMLSVLFGGDPRRAAPPLPGRKTAPAAANGTLLLNPFVPLLYCLISTRNRAPYAIWWGFPPCRLPPTRPKSGCSGREWYTPSFSFGIFLLPDCIY